MTGFFRTSTTSLNIKECTFKVATINSIDTYSCTDKLYVKV